MIRRLGSFDAALIVMGGILGSGIFLNPSIVAGYVRAPGLAMLLWIAGGAIALAGAGLFAELAARRPMDGGLYAYLREAYHPSIAFVYGWTLLLVAQSGGMAAGAVTFAIYVVPLLGLHVSTGVVGALVIAAFTLVNCFGVRQGATTQHLFMGLNAAMILICAGLALFAHPAASAQAYVPLANVALPGAIGLALVAVLFAYDGWHSASFINAELRDPARNLPRGITIGVAVVVALYLLANWAFTHGLGIVPLAKTQTPATDLAAAVVGTHAAGAIAALVAVATMSTLSQQILVSPRVYHQMAADGAFFQLLARVDPRTGVPVTAIVAQGLTAAIVALSGRYDQILNYVESVDFVFFALAAVALVIFRRRDAGRAVGFSLPLYPWSALLFAVICVGIVVDIAISSPKDTLVGLGIMGAGVPVYWLFRSRRSS